MLRPGLQLLARFKTGQPDSKPANPFRNRLGNFTHVYILFFFIDTVSPRKYSYGKDLFNYKYYSKI